MSQARTLNFGYIKQGNILIPTINSLDTIITFSPDPKPIVQRKTKETFVFKTADNSDQTESNGSLRTQLKNELGPGVFTEDPCQLPYEAGLDFQLRVGAGVDALFAGATGGVQMNLGGGISYDDDRNFRAYYYYHFSAYIKAYFLASSVDASYLFYGRQVDKCFDGINHFSRYINAFAMGKLYDVKKACLISVGFRPQTPNHFVAIKTPSIVNAEFIGVSMADRKFDVSFNSSSTKDLYIRTKDGGVINGLTQNRTFSIKGLFPTFSIGKIAQFDIILNLIFDKVDNNYNTNNDGEYFGIALDFILSPKNGNEPSVAVKEDLYNKVQKAAESFQGIMDSLFNFFSSYKTALPNYYSIREVLRNNQKGLVDELKKITLDTNLKPAVKSSGFSFSGSLGLQYLRYWVKEEGGHNIQYSRISVLGNIEIGYRKEVRYGLFIGELDAKIDLSMKAAIAESASDQTTTYLHTVYDGVNSNIEGNRKSYEPFPLGSKVVNAFLPYWRNHRSEFGVAATLEQTRNLKSQSRKPIDQESAANQGEQNALHYLENYRMKKLSSDDKKWIKEKDRTLGVLINVVSKEKRITCKVASSSVLKFSSLKEALTYSNVGNVKFTGVKYTFDGVKYVALNKESTSNDLFFVSFLKNLIHPKQPKGVMLMDNVLFRFVTSWNFSTTDLQTNITEIVKFFESADKYFDFQKGGKEKVIDFKSNLRKNILRDIKKTSKNLPDQIFKSLTKAIDDDSRYGVKNDSNQNIDLGNSRYQKTMNKYDFTPTSYHRNFVATGIVAEDYLDRFVNLVLLYAKIS